MIRRNTKHVLETNANYLLNHTGCGKAALPVNEPLGDSKLHPFSDPTLVLLIMPEFTESIQCARHYSNCFVCLNLTTAL